jgi:ribosomal protein S18 acetylase RimI-like enzyme
MRDVMEMQHCNLRCLPENYNLRYYHYHKCSWPQLLYVCEDINGVICGYVLSKMDDEEDDKKKHGHITSLAVLRTHRKLGAANKVMLAAQRDMKQIYGAHFCSLHVRRTNGAARHLYQESLGYRTHEVDEKYYVDDEDAFHMKKYFNPSGNERVGYVERDGSITWSALKDSPGMQKCLDLAGRPMKEGGGKAGGGSSSGPVAASPVTPSLQAVAAGDNPNTVEGGAKPTGKAGGKPGGKGAKGQSAAAAGAAVEGEYAKLQRELEEEAKAEKAKAGGAQGGGKKGSKK